MLLICSVVCFGAELRVDHVTVCGASLQEMQPRYEKSGLKFEYGGAHAGHATEMALASFADGSYIELIAIQPQADPKAVAAHAWSRQMRENAGPCGWAVRVPDLGAEAARLKASGVVVEPVVRSARVRPDGFRLEWEMAQVGTEGHGVFFPFLIHDFTARDQRAFPSGKPNNPGLPGVTRVVIAVSDVARGTERYRKAYGGLPAVVSIEARPDRVRKFGEGVCEFRVGKVVVN